MSIKSIILRATFGIALATSVATVATAATLSVVNNGSGVATTLPVGTGGSSGFDLSSIYGSASPNVGDPITSFSAATGGTVNGGLYIDGSSELTYTFLGTEAGARNSVFGLGGATVTNRQALGTSFTVNHTGAGFVDFFFQTLERTWEDLNRNMIVNEALTIANNGLSAFGNLSMAFGEVFNNNSSVLVFFGDGRGDGDYDDMVVRIDASVVPLPATAFLMLGALGGLGALRGRKKKAIA
ncbi:MAG: VPLPA-CTERM sorting domain-containing protein [Marinosulfonomonas sp.]|nr:VPLPA-CTERM sorting domain-containing protein [Marinosulfonomonas sp.]